MNGKPYTLHNLQDTTMEGKLLPPVSELFASHFASIAVWWKRFTVVALCGRCPQRCIVQTPSDQLSDFSVDIFLHLPFKKQSNGTSCTTTHLGMKRPLLL